MDVIKKFSDNSALLQGQGSFDEFCIYLERPNQKKYAIKDEEYFTQLKSYYEEHGTAIYDDFINIYNLTGKTNDQSTLDQITKLSSKYSKDSLEIDIVYSILYLGMVAEENKANTKLGKKIKRLGVHQLLKDGFSPNEAANYSRNKKAAELVEECAQRGF